MNDIDNGGPAFPVVETHPVMGTRVESGMTLRDYFAAKAMQSLIADTVYEAESMAGMPQSEFYESIAMSSYIAADAMLKARSK